MSAEKPPASCWADLLPDLIRDISSRLNDPIDFVRFHAICRPWRDVQPHPPVVRRMFLPWLLGTCNGLILHSVVNFGSVATSSYRRKCDDIIVGKPPAAPSGHDRNWVASADGTATWFFTWSPEPRLVDLLTGDVTPLPLFPCDAETRKIMENPRGIVYSDGTIFMYSFIPHVGHPCTSIFKAAILRPGDVVWMSVKKELSVVTSHFALAYHDGNILMCIGVNLWCVLAVDDDRCSDIMPGWWKDYESKYRRVDSYVLESNGELLWASILIEKSSYLWRYYDGHGEDPPQVALSLIVHALEGANGDDGMQWVPRDGRSLGNRVFFLGLSVSFSMDASQLGMAGGCAYFIFGPNLFKFNLINNEAKLITRLRSPGWEAVGCSVWLRPQPTIAPIQEIKVRLGASKKRKRLQD